MRSIRGSVITTATAMALVLSSPGFADKVSRNAVLSGSCFSCHGPDGHSPGQIPSIAGKPADFIRRSLAEFASGARPSTVMGRHAKGYTDEEIDLIAKYFADK